MKAGQRFARFVTDVVVRRPFLWRVFRAPLRRTFDRLAPVWDEMRLPEAFAPVEAALEALPEQPQNVLDLGTGTGAIALALLSQVKAAVATGADISREALSAAAINAENSGLGDRFTTVCSDWFENISGKWDVIVSNPPYIPSASIAGLAREVPGSALEATFTAHRDADAFGVAIPLVRWTGQHRAPLLVMSDARLEGGDRSKPSLTVGGFATGGADLPQISGRLEQTADGRRVVRLAMAQYRAQSATLSLPGLQVIGTRAGAFGFAGAT